MKFTVSKTLGFRALLLTFTAGLSLPPEPIYAGGLIGTCATLVRRILSGASDVGNLGLPAEVVVTDPLFIASASFSHDEASAAFAREPRLVLQLDLGVEGGAFPVSNEYDFYKGPRIPHQRDMVIGFATNSAWDVAVRADAKTLMLADWQETPLMGQEYLLRPLVLIASDRADFLSMLAGIPLGQNAKQPIDITLDFLRAGAGDLPTSARLIYMNSVLQRVRADSRFSDMHVKFIARYFHSLLIRDFKGKDSPVDAGEEHIRRILSSAPTRGDVAGPFRGPKIEVIAGDIFGHFYERYHPARLTEFGGLGDPYHNVFSSEASFARLQNLLNGVTYAQGSLFDPALWQKAKEIGAQRGATSYVASLSNILDCSYGGCHEGPGTVRTALTLISRILGAVDVLQTRGSKAPYDYEWIPLSGPSDVSSQLAAHGYPAAEITSLARSKAQKVMRYMASNKANVLQILTDRVEIEYGQFLKVSMIKPRAGSKDFGWEFSLWKDGKWSVVFFDIPEDYRRASEKVLLQLGELRETNSSLNDFFAFHLSGTTQP